MKLDPTYLTYITKEEMRVLLAVEMGMRNHEYVPTHLIEKISRLNRSCAYTYLKLLNKNKLVYHQRKCYDGYKLTYLGYDYLALHVLMKRGEIKDVIGKIGVGKESDIYKCTNDNGEEVVLKLARLGRVSFKTVKNNRDYIKHRTQYNWLYLSRLQAIKEYSFMEMLHKNGFPTPTPKSQNRHAIVMTLADGVPMTQVRSYADPSSTHNELIDLITKLAEHGLIHSDFNEFNLIINPKNFKITMIDFPQMVSTKHLNAKMYFERDINCIHRYFRKKQKFETEYTMKFEEVERVKDLDIEIQASGFIKKELKNAKELDILDDLVREGDDAEQDSDYSGEEDDQQYEEDSQEDQQEDDEEEEDQEDQDDQEDEEEEEIKEQEQDQQNFEEIKQNEEFHLDSEDDDFNLNEDGNFNQEELNKADEKWNFDSDDNQEQQEQEEEEEEEQDKKKKKKDKKKKNKGDSQKLREQLLQKIKLKEQLENKQKQQLEQQDQNDGEGEQQDLEQDEEYQRINYENEELIKRVEKNVQQQVNKQLKTKFKIQKYNKRGAKDVKDKADAFF